MASEQAKQTASRFPGQFISLEQTLGQLRTIFYDAALKPRDCDTHGDVGYGEVSGGPEPVGDPAAQCWRFDVQDANILGTDLPRAVIDTPDCVVLQSAAIARGRATFILCCKKGDDHRCKDCSSNIQLQVLRGTRLIATEDVRIVCSPAV